MKHKLYDVCRYKLLWKTLHVCRCNLLWEILHDVCRYELLWEILQNVCRYNYYGKYYMMCAGIYLMVVLATSCLSVLSSVLVLSIHHQRGRPRRVPGWLRYVVFRVVARLVCVRTYSYHYRYSASTSSSSSATSRDKRRQQSVARHKERKASVTLKKIKK